MLKKRSWYENNKYVWSVADQIENIFVKNDENVQT